MSVLHNSVPLVVRPRAAVPAETPQGKGESEPVSNHPEGLVVMLPLVSLIGDGPAPKFLATVEGLVVAPLVAAKLAYGNENMNWKQFQSRPHVQKYMLYLRGKLAMGMGITRENVLVQLQETFLRATMNNDFKAAVGSMKEVADIMGWKHRDAGNVRIDVQGNVINIVKAAPDAAPQEEVIDAEIMAEVMAMNGRSDVVDAEGS